MNRLARWFIYIGLWMVLANLVGWGFVYVLAWTTLEEDGFLDQVYNSTKESGKHALTLRTPEDRDYKVASSSLVTARVLACETFLLNQHPAQQLDPFEGMGACSGSRQGKPHAVASVLVSNTLVIDDLESEAQVLFLSDEPFRVNYQGRPFSTRNYINLGLFGVVVLILCLVLNVVLYAIAKEEYDRAVREIERKKQREHVG